MMHRYPGSRSFTSDYRHLFFGRDDEKQELFRLIVLNDLVVLFGESGSGKTSLLQAGVCPELEESQYKPVFIRLNDTDKSPESQVCAQLKEGGYLPAELPEDRSLWEYFSRFWYVDLGEVFTPVIVFDQFEELFTLYTPDQRAAFIAQFAAIVNRRPPVGLPPEAATPPRAKFVFSLRSDFLYLLDELSADIPAILRCRFQLRPLDRDRAVAAITRPAAMPGDFASPAFGYSPAALDNILEALGRRGASSLGSSTAPPAHPTTDAPLGEIAAFQLQMVCQHLEGRVIQQKQAAGFQISPAFYGYAEGIERIINEFYHGVLDKIPAAEQEAVQKLLARGLIRNGRRIMMEASAMRDEYSVSQPVLELLHAERLLKRETRKGELYYEISHDTLVGPVLERFKTVEAAERKAELDRQAALIVQEKAEAERRRKRALATAVVATFLVLAAIVATIFAFNKSAEAERQAQKATQAIALADQKTKEATVSDSLAQVKTAAATTAEQAATLQKEIADLKSKEAKTATEQALLKKKEAELSAIQAVVAIVAQARQDILRLDYEAAFSKVKNAASLNAVQDSVAFECMEIAYFYHHTGQNDRARAPYDLAAGLLGKTHLKGKMDFESLNPDRARFLEERYFPNIQALSGGSFLMGRDSTREDGQKDELPRHEVQLSPFGLAATETTFWQWAIYITDKKRDLSRYAPSWGIAGDNPAVYLDWFDACEYANWLSGREGKKPFYEIDSTAGPNSRADWKVELQPNGNGYRLPTEAEWEYAARGGPGTPYYIYAGSNSLDLVGWYNGNSRIGGVNRTHPVGQKQSVVFPGDKKIFDLSGNVWEWCWDGWEENYYEQFRSSGAKNPLGPEDWTTVRVLRGGSWYDFDLFCRSAFRYRDDGNDRSSNRGFRLARHQN